MTCSPLDLSPSPSLTPTTCRSRQKKFQRHFNVDPDEQVIDYYSCALVADILLQGHLYISKNYFAFYSNVFGYVTKLLIPTASVVNVTKEKTAFILPNAVGVMTADDRHVFSSLLSRDTTYRLMLQVWRSAHLATSLQSITVSEVAAEPELPRREESSSPSGSESVYDVKPSSANNVHVPTLEPVKEPPSPSQLDISPNISSSILSLPRSTVLLAVATALLLALFLSASVLMYKLSMLQHAFRSHNSGSRALYEVQEYLDMNLNSLYKVRQSLEVLSLLMEDGKENSAKEVVENHQRDSLKVTDDLLMSQQGLGRQTEETVAS